MVMLLVCCSCCHNLLFISTSSVWMSLLCASYGWRCRIRSACKCNAIAMAIKHSGICRWSCRRWRRWWRPGRNGCRLLLLLLLWVFEIEIRGATTMCGSFLIKSSSISSSSSGESTSEIGENGGRRWWCASPIGIMAIFRSANLLWWWWSIGL